MTVDEVVERLAVGAWYGPFDPAIEARAVEALESGKVLVLPDLLFALAPDETRLLDPATLGEHGKNISLDPQAHRLSNTAVPAADAAALAGMMQRFADASLALLTGLLPRYAAQLERARTSFRPAEIEGRVSSPRRDDRRLHIDAFPTRPLAGRRILRVFCNVAPDGAAREWLVGEQFIDYARTLLPRVKAPVPGSAWVLERLGLTKGRRARYDHIMLGMHDAGKFDAGYQEHAPRAAVSFSPGTTWICFTDQVVHAALAGHCALEQTFHLPIAAMLHPERSPLRVLEAMTGRRLAG
jgi:hypothetical protein